MFLNQNCVIDFDVFFYVHFLLLFIVLFQYLIDIVFVFLLGPEIYYKI